MKKKTHAAILLIITFILATYLISELTLVVAQEPHGVITITFDDNMKNQYDYAYPLMKARGMVGTFYAVTDHIADFSGDYNTYMSIADLQTLQADGNEIGSHSVSHPHFTQLTDEQIRAECINSRTILRNNGLPAINFAYPYGDRDDRTDAIVSEYYRSGRPSWSPSYTTPLPVTTWLIIGTTGETGTPDVLSLLKSMVDQVYSSNEWGVIYFHNVVPYATSDPYSISEQDFESFLDYIVYKGLSTVTVNQALDRYTPPTEPLSSTISPTSVRMDVGQSKTFTSTVTGGEQPYSYQWYINDSAVYGATSSTWNFTPSQAGYYSVYLEVIDSLNYQVQSNTVNDIIVYNQPSVSINPFTVNTTIGESQQLSSNVTGGVAPYTYQWYYANGTAIAGATASNLIFKANSTGTYNIYLNVNDSLSCKIKSNNAFINVYSKPTVIITLSSVNMTVGTTQQFTSTLTGGLTPYTYQWYLNDTAISGATDSTWNFVPSTAGCCKVYLIITDSLNSSVQSNIVTNITINPQLAVSEDRVGEVSIVIIFLSTILLIASFVRNKNKKMSWLQKPK